MNNGLLRALRSLQLLLMLVSAVAGLPLSVATAGVVLFEDNFDDGVIDSNKWNTRNTVTEHDGYMDQQQAITDQVPYLFSKPIILNNPNGLITFTQRTLTHYANQYFRGGALTLVGLPDGTTTGAEDPANEGNTLFSVAHLNFHYRSDQVLFGEWGGEGANPANFPAYFLPIWDQWVTEVVVYNPLTGITTYSLNDATPVTYSQSTVQVLRSNTIGIRLFT